MRAIALICLIALALAGAFSRPHAHGMAVRGGESTSCAACLLGSNPAELSEQAPAPVAIAVEVKPEQALSAEPRAERCLVRAPKQGPPAA